MFIFTEKIQLFIVEKGRFWAGKWQWNVDVCRLLGHGFCIPLCDFLNFWLKKAGCGKDGKRKGIGKSESSEPTLAWGRRENDKGMPKGDDRDANAGQRAVWKCIFYFKAAKGATGQAGYGRRGESDHRCRQRLSYTEAKGKARALAVCFGLCLRRGACCFLYTFIIYLTREAIWCIMKWIYF